MKSRIMYQERRHLLFLHWKFDKKHIQKTLPPGLYVDTFEDTAYLTIAPFFIQNLNLSVLPALPFLSDFIEVNVRTYVYDEKGTPGIWLYTLDINSLIATAFGRMFFFLPYQNTQLASYQNNQEIKIWGKRLTKKNVKMEFKFHILDESKSSKADLNPLDFFLLERYALFSYYDNQLYSKKIHHAPYTLSSVNLTEYQSNLLDATQFQLNRPKPDIIHYCRGLDVDFFSLEKIR